MKTKFTQINLRAFLLAALFMPLFQGVQAQTTHTVDVTNNEYTPAVITISPGDEVTWTNSEGFHNVNGTTGTYPDNPESFGNNTGTGWTFSHTFNTPGVYDYQCDPHVGVGMVGQVIVEESLFKLTVNFTGMDPHVGQMMKLFVKDQSSGETLDSVVLSSIEDADFDIESHILEVGGDYFVDFYADLNQSGGYDAPPTDHAWRLVVDNAMGDVDLDFTHNTTFTDIMNEGTTSAASTYAKMALKVYPNPAASLITIESESMIRSAEIFSISGAVVKSVPGIDSRRRSISLDGLAGGVYFIKVTSDNAAGASLRIIKQ